VLQLQYKLNVDTFFTYDILLRTEVFSYLCLANHTIDSCIYCGIGAEQSIVFCVTITVVLQIA